MGPAWLGIGAQRSGTTWFTDLLLQHPHVSLSTAGRKELHALYMPDVDLASYRALFDGCAGVDAVLPARTLGAVGRGEGAQVRLGGPGHPA
jgi:hypothetical protein